MESKDVIKISFSPQFPPTGFPVIGSGWEGRLNGHKTTTIRQKKKLHEGTEGLYRNSESPNK